MTEKKPSLAGRRSIAVIYVGLAVLSSLVFAQTLRHDFINFDDPSYVYENRNVTSGLSLHGVAWAFTHVHSDNWHPVTTLSHMLDCQLYGLNPSGHHLTNVLLHACAVLLLFYTLRRMTGAIWRSAFVAAVFAIHPLRVESVAWIAERKDVLSGVFFMLTVACYSRYARRPSIRTYFIVLAMFALGLMSKPMLVTVPFVLILLDYWPLQRISSVSPSRVVLEKIPMLCLSALSSMATLLAQKQYIAVGEDLPLPARLGNAAISYAAYVRQMFWPTTLVPFYPHSQQPVPVAATIAAVALLLALTLFAFVIRKKWPYVTVGWFWYVGMLVPVIGVVQVGWQARADRYTYLPQIGLYIAITWIAADLAPRLRLPRLSVAICAAAVVAALASVSFLQAAYWRDSEKLWNHTLAVTPQNDVAENNLGIVLLARGREDEAIAHYEAALRLRPQNVPAHINLANALIHRGAVSDSIAHLRAALEFDPDNADAGNLLGVLLMRRGDIGSALEQWNKTLQANSDNGNARGNLAWVYATHPDPAIRDGRRGLRLAKEAAEIAGGRNAFVLRTLAAAYAENGRFEDAIGTARAAREVAIEQKNTGLVTELDATIRLYEAHVPLRDRSLPQRSSASG